MNAYRTLELIRRTAASRESAEISDASRLANELQFAYPGLKRSQALLEAERLQALHGFGLTLAPKGE